jgi:hypothetical protein
MSRGTSQRPVAAPIPHGVLVPRNADVQVVLCTGPGRYAGVPGKPAGYRVNRATRNDFGRQPGDAAYACCSWIDDTPRTAREILALAGYTRSSWSGPLFTDLIAEGHVRKGPRRVCQVSGSVAQTYLRSGRHKGGHKRAGDGAGKKRRKLLGPVGRADRCDPAQGSVCDAYLRFSAEQLQVILPLHAKLSMAFKDWLQSVGASSVRREVEGVDLRCVADNRACLFELKICHQQSTRHALREALGQVLEYGFFPRRARSDALAIVLDKPPSADDVRWFGNLRQVGIAVELFWLVAGEVLCGRITNHPLAPRARLRPPKHGRG